MRIRAIISILLISIVYSLGTSGQLLAEPRLADRGSSTAALNVEWPFDVETRSPHDVRVFDDGLSALAWRLEMIERAQTKIDYMTYVFKPDLSGRLLLKALIDRAVHGVHVRLLLDGYGGDSGQPDVTESMVAAIQDHLRRAHATKNVFEVRYYNKNSLLNAVDPLHHEHRNHAKLLIADGRELLIGGRNSSDVSFGLAPAGRDFLDREIWATALAGGPRSSVAVQADEVFDRYWQNEKWTSAVGGGVGVDDAFARVMFDSAASQFQQDVLFRAVLQRKTETMLQRQHVFTVHHLRLVVDRPGHQASDRRVTPAWESDFSHAGREVWIENDTFIPTARKVRLMTDLSRRHVPVTVLTNSFADSQLTAHDREMARYSFNAEVTLLKAERGLRVFHLMGHASSEQQDLQARKTSVNFYDHTKSMIIFNALNAETLIGSYNLDPRSENINNEALLIVDDVPFAMAVRASMQNRQQVAQELLVDGRGVALYAPPTVRLEVPDRGWLGQLSEWIGLDGLIREHY